MAYPKPLSEKSLTKMYREANLDEEKSIFLHQFFLSAANLYGIAVLRDLWDILKEIAPQYGMSDIKRKDLIAFSSIVRRENVPYYVYEIDELYSDEKKNTLDREIVHKTLVRSGYGKMACYYNLADAQADTTYYIPKDFLTYAAASATREEDQLLRFLERLKVTAKETEIRYNKKIVCTHTGETLGNFSFRNRCEDIDYKFFSGEYPKHPSKNEKALQELAERTGCSEAEKIFRIYKEDCNFGRISPSEALGKVFDELNEVGVELTEKDFEKLTGLLVKFNNNSHLWCTRGWTPTELANRTPQTGPTSISLGPGILQAIAEGKIDRNELEAEFRKRGIALVE